MVDAKNKGSRLKYFFLKTMEGSDNENEGESFTIALKIAGIYMITGILWVLLSDYFLASTVRKKETFTFLSIIKEWLYVILSGGIIFLLVANFFKRIRTAQKNFKQKFKELQAFQEKLRSMAYHDDLTGLPNRVALREALKARIKDLPDEKMALMFVDSDNIKFVNDTMGHSFGDLIIAEIGKKLSGMFDKQHLVFRLGGDEFIILCCGFESLDNVVEWAERILQSFSQPIEIKGSTLYTTVSIGISIYPEDGTDPDGLMLSADIAMYRAKASGKNRYVFYHQAMQETINKRMTIEKQLRSALKKNEFILHFQPQIDIKSGVITGFEALLRWNNPELGFVYPSEFIGIAEETHLIIPIGEWVLRNACFFLKKLQVMGHTGLSIAVNISILQLIQEDFVDSVLRLLDFLDMPPDCLELEITESVLTESFQTINDKLHRLREKGVKIALDDFGQGYSSLSYLRQLHINTLKIDRSFVAGIDSVEDNDSLTDAIIMIGRKMGLTILAEGVENSEQLNYLKKHGCDKIQGYLVSKPLPFDDVLKFCEEWKQAELQ